jgi:hypothetical protein
MAMTIQNRLVKALMARGSTIIEDRGRYGIKMSRYDDKEGFFFLGTQGSIHLGRNKTNSFPCNALKSKLLTEA